MLFYIKCCPRGHFLKIESASTSYVDTIITNQQVNMLVDGDVHCLKILVICDCFVALINNPMAVL